MIQEEKKNALKGKMSIVSTPIKVDIDPKKLVHDDDANLLIVIIGYTEEKQPGYKVKTATVQNQLLSKKGWG
ncbi:MAG: hypothetical protein MJZ99_10950 [Bacteroidales bacterium]|nr:hypothetical protein [Candidatus Colimorpha merdihippi]MCQ2283121.1 hypothetical protein [Bacteroidales bacterium]